MKFVICITTSADASADFEISDERLAEILNGEEFDPENEAHRNAVDDEFWATNPDTPSICASCSGWGQSHSLSIGEGEWSVTDVFKKGEWDE